MNKNYAFLILKVRKTQMLWVIIIIFLLLSADCLHAQIINKGQLVKGKIFHEKIKKGEEHHYKVELQEEQFSFIKLKQIGIDVIVTTLDQDNKKMKEFNTLNGSYGPEYVTLKSSKKGQYTVVIAPINDVDSSGDYEIELKDAKPKATTKSEQIDELFSQWTSETPGIAVAIIKNGEIDLKKAYGSANLENNIPITSHTVFNIGSISKQFTAFAAFLLAHENKLSMDDDVRKYIPELPDFGKTITLQQLANHTSGLRGILGISALTGNSLHTNDQVLKLLCNQNELNYNPGEKFLYINSGYFLLAMVVERVSGMPFSEYAKENIFKPLNMIHTQVFDNYQLVINELANSYTPDGNDFMKNFINNGIVGPGNICLNIEDLSLWAANFINPIVGNEDIIKQMNTSIELNNGTSINWYANGQELKSDHGFNYYRHGGVAAGYRSFLGRFPDQDLAIVILSNDGAFDYYGMGLKVAEIYLKDDANYKDTETTENNGTQKMLVKLDEVRTKSLCGKYELAPGMIIDIFCEEGKLFGTAPGQSKLALYAISQTKFKIQGVDGMVNFKKDEKGEINMLVLTLSGNSSYARKIKFDASMLDLLSFEGEYYSSELGTVYTLTLQQGNLVAKHVIAENVSLTPISKDKFIGNKWPFSEMEIVRNINNDIIGFRVSSARCKNVLFKKLKNNDDNW